MIWLQLFILEQVMKCFLQKLQELFCIKNLKTGCILIRLDYIWRWVTIETITLVIAIVLLNVYNGARDTASHLSLPVLLLMRRTSRTGAPNIISSARIYSKEYKNRFITHFNVNQNIFYDRTLQSAEISHFISVLGQGHLKFGKLAIFWGILWIDSPGQVYLKLSQLSLVFLRLSPPPVAADFGAGWCLWVCLSSISPPLYLLFDQTCDSYHGCLSPTTYTLIQVIYIQIYRK